MFTVKTNGEYELTINCDPDDFVWKKYFPNSHTYMYKYPDVPEFMTNFEIFGSENHGKFPEVPRKGQKYVILETDWHLNGIEDDFFGLKKGDIITVSDVEQHDDECEWAAFVKRDDRMITMDDNTAVGEEVVCFTHEHVMLNVIARYTEV